MKKLIIITSILIMLTIMVAIAVTLTSNATITNDMAMDQLNGGDGEYMVMQAYYQYRNASVAALYTIGGLTFAFISILIFNIVKTLKNTKGE